MGRSDRRSRHSRAALLRGLALIGSLLVAGAAPASASELGPDPGAQSEACELRPLDDAELALVHAMGPAAPTTEARKRVILWDEALSRDPARRGAYLSPETAGGTNRITLRDGR